MAYLVPVRGGPRLLTDVDNWWDASLAIVVAVSCHLEMEVDFQARELYLELFILICSPDER